MESLTNKNILLGITGGIAVFKSADLARRLREAGAQVRVVMTRSAMEFIAPLTLQALSGNPVHWNLLDANAEAAMGHIELARWAEVVLVAPTSADFIAKLTYGHADDLLSTLCLATRAPLVLVPAMNQQMWANGITQENVQHLLARAVQFIGPASGAQACGEVGPGRMVEPLEIVSYLTQLFIPKLLIGKTVLVTAGPTRENIDPVRYLSNRSSGKMGYAVAEAAQAMGANVTLISGPVNQVVPHGVHCVSVQSAEEMFNAALTAAQNADIFIAAAAVADYRCAATAMQKIAKEDAELTLKLIRNPDILAAVADLPKPPFCVGFAAETENVVEHAKAKLRTKKLAMIAANQVAAEQNMGFEADENELTVLWEKGECTLPRAPKKQLARALMMLIAEHYLQ